MLTNVFSSVLINQLAPNRAINTDLLFMFTPYVRGLQFATDPILIFALCLLIYYVVTKKKHSLSYYFIAFGYLYILRGIFLPLTPLGRPTGNNDPYGYLGAIPQPGMFPSGHTAAICLAYLIIEERNSSLIKVLMLILIVLEVVVLILSRGHYSIDIVGGALLAYVTYILAIKTRVMTSEKAKQLVNW